MTEDQSRSAISDRREQIKGMDRPERLNEGFSIKEAVQGVRETEDLVKLYLREWQVKFVSTASGEDGKAQCQAEFAAKFEGRVHEEDVKVVSVLDAFLDRDGITAVPEDWPYRLELRLPNVRGEFKHRVEAEDFATTHEWTDIEIVARNSREDYALRDYGVKKLLVKRS